MPQLVPQPILAQLAARTEREQIPSVALFADISGFTALTERLAEHGIEGAELLAEALRFHFDPLVTAVHSAGGFITGFAGDAFTAVFPLESQASQVTARALEAALSMRAFFAAHPVWKNKHGEFPFALKLGVCVDVVVADVVQPEGGRAIWYFHGAGIDRCAQAEHRANKGDLVAASEVGRLLPGLQLEPREDGHLAVTGLGTVVPDASPAPAPAPATGEAAFLLPAALEFPREGEFRDVTTVFLSFSNVPELAPFARLVASTLARFSDGLLRVEFGDKGGVAWAFFGAPLAHDDDTDRALAFVSELFARREASIGLKAGVSRGATYAGFLGGEARAELTCLGRPVNLAARLMQAATPGEVLASESVKARTRAFRFEGERTLTLKGFAEPVTATLLAGRASRVRALATTMLVGRKRELAALEKAVGPALDGRFAGFTYLDGEAGLGKSHLVEALHKSLLARAHGLVWLHAPCDPTLKESLWPFGYCLRAWAGITGEHKPQDAQLCLDAAIDDLVVRLGAVPGGADEGAELARVRSFLAALLGLRTGQSLYESLDPRLRHLNTLSAIRTLLAALARVSQVMLVVEDAMWIDEDSTEVLRALARAPIPIAVLLTCRLRDDGSPHRLDLGEGVERVEILLKELDRVAIEELAHARLGEAPAPALVDLLARVSGGNPFFAEQVLAWLDDQAALAPGPAGVGPSRQDVAVPEDVGALLVSRLDRLAGDVRRTVQAASVLGRELEVSTLSRMLGTTTEGEILQHVALAERAQVWADLGEMRLLFRHALLRDAAYNMQARARLRLLHKLAGETLELAHASDLAPRLGELAHHYDTAEVPAKAAEFLRRAGEHEASEWRNQEALAHFDRLLRWLPARGPERRSAEIARAHVLKALARWPECLDACARARAAEDGGDVGLCVLESLCLTSLRRLPEAQRISEEGLALARASADPLSIGRAENAAGTVLLQCGELGPAWESFLRSEEACLRGNDVAQAGVAANNKGFVAYLREGPRVSVTWLERALELHRTARNRPAESLTLNNLGYSYWTVGDNARSISLLEASAALARELGDRQTEARATGNLGLPFYDLGNAERAIACLEAGIQIWRSIGDHNPFFDIMLAEVLRRLGRAAPAAAALEKARLQLRAYVHPEHQGWLGLTEGHFLRDAGDEAGARAQYQSTLVEAEAKQIAVVAVQARKSLAALEAGTKIPPLAPAL